METKPFHESIIDAIQNCGGENGVSSRQNLIILGKLLITTTIPENHEKILMEFKKSIEYWSSNHHEQDMRGLISRVEKKLMHEKISD